MINGKQKWNEIYCLQKNDNYNLLCIRTHARAHTWWNNYTVLEYDKHVKLQWMDVIWFSI